MTALKAVGIFLGVCLLAVAVYLGSWWLNADSMRRSGEIRRQTFEAQQGSIDAAVHKIAEIRDVDSQIEANPESTALPVQRKAMVRETCVLISRVPGDLPEDLTSFKAQECNR